MWYIPPMTQSEKLIKVLEVIVSKLYSGEAFDDYNSFIYIEEKDLTDVNLSFHTFGATLRTLQDLGVCKLDLYKEPIAKALDERDVDSYSLENPTVRFRLFVDGNPWRILEELEQGILLKDISTKALKFDTGRSILEVRGHTIRIARQNVKPIEHYILEYIFNNDTEQEYGYAEMKEAGVYDSNASIQTYINACKTLNGKIKKETKDAILDFLIYGKTEVGSVKISPVYLNK